MRKMIRLLLPATAVLLLLVCRPFAAASETQPHKPAPQDKCPVCGMFVGRYPDWIGQIIFVDGSVAFFEGPRTFSSTTST